MTDKPYQVETGKRHTFRLDFQMTISFVLNESGQVDGDYPIYTLESSDGSYYQTLSAGSDLVLAGDFMQLQFKNLARGKNYKLTRLMDEDFEEVVFHDIPFATIVDQDREVHKVLEDHAYGELDVDIGSTVDALSWQPAGGGDPPGDAT